MGLNILVVMKVEEEHKSVLQSAAPDAVINYIDESIVGYDDAKEADIIVGNINPQLIKGSSKLKLLQLNSAGTDGYTAPGVLPEQTVLTNASGSYGLAISEYMLAALMCMMKRLDSYRMNQEKGLWEDLGPVNSIYGSKTLVVGLGDIGSEFAKRMDALGSTVYGIRRNTLVKPDYVDSITNMEGLSDMLGIADIVASCLPGTSETKKIFDETAFAKMKKGAYFINVGRGNAVDTDALYNALCSGHLAGAALDVTDPEPLPSDHKLWRAPGILITPHVSGGYHLRETHDRIINLAASNIRNYIDGNPYISEVDMNTGYRKI